MSNSDNSDNKLVNLPHILLSKIVKELGENIDIISFSLVCKKWFKDRDSYIVFNFNHILASNSLDDLKSFHWNSYRKQIEYSKSIKPNCKLCFCTNDELTIYDPKYVNFDYVLDYELYYVENQPLVIPSNVDDITFSNSFNHSLDLISDALALSNNNVKSLHFGAQFNQPLTPGSLPPTITSLSLSEHFNQPLDIDSLPSSLTSLVFGPHFNQELRPGVLPQSLRYLELGETFNQPFGHGSLPPNLVEIVFYNDVQSPILDAQVIPQSLRAIENIPPSWMEQLDLMPQLNRISIKKLPALIFPAGSIPPNITKLDFGFNASFILHDGVLPPMLKSLKLGRCSYRLEHLFPKQQNSDGGGLELDVLYLGSSYSHPIRAGTLPKFGVSP
ncbi:hypothetical protein PPL_12345 [Heterostelium album PN500]|uniref:F-box domain-containing protein n=1 Tax=Heterostelium pallidum (strain ATCC 26659 / Pp 5 / PN500) TaxID=670386 RepID=D3BMD2_HETP5|nr:hypothetical protein PPL_12345 [Heterostelium album PN500]EFA77733.1 hypothetical protein PPL_12345 [Heterostelium album PN500]|eukprot:XP_020429861.1 hypothetical protein PPL_12345 [Heterostelium album PN500]